MFSFRRILRFTACAIACLPLQSMAASEWVIGKVSVIDDWRATDASAGVLVTLSEITYYSGGSVPAICGARFRIAVGQEGITADIQKSLFSMLLTARATGDVVRLLANPANLLSGGLCQGSSLDVNGNPVPPNSPAAHWPIK